MNYTNLLPCGPVLGWTSFTGSHAATLPSVQDLPHVALNSSGRTAIFQALQLLALASNRDNTSVTCL